MAKRRVTANRRIKVSVKYAPWETAGVRPEHQARRVPGMIGVDYQERVNFERLRRERLQKLQASMEKEGLTALLLYNGDNVRYATGTWDNTWRGHAMRYCLVPVGGKPIIFETIGCDWEAARMHAPWLDGNIRHSISYVFNPGEAFTWARDRQVKQIKEALGDLRVKPKDRVGVDSMDFSLHAEMVKAGVNLVPGFPAVAGARWFKTKDELELLKIACAMADAVFGMLKNEWVKPGVRECELEAKITEFMLSHGMTSGFTIVASGGNTNPYVRGWGDKIVRTGDMVIMDIIWSFLGYTSDFCRCWPCDAKFTPEQRDVYRRAYYSMKRAQDALRPGKTSADVAKEFEEYADDVYGSCPVVNAAHSMGLGLYEGYWISRAFSLRYPVPILEGMYFAVETYAGNPGSDTAARLEENGVITADGIVPFSLFPFEEEALD